MLQMASGLSAAKRRIITFQCNKWLLARKLPCARRIPVRVPRQELVPHMKGKVRAALQAAKIGSLSGTDLQIARYWVRSLVQVTVEKPPMWSDNWSAQKAARHSNVSLQPSVLPCTGPFYCVRKNWCIEKREEPNKMLQKALHRVKGLFMLRSIHLPALTTHLVYAGPARSLVHRWRDTESRYAEDVESFHIPSGYTCVPDDKTRSGHGLFARHFMHCYLRILRGLLDLGVPVPFRQKRLMRGAV